jgi:hypothetical protein
MFAPKNKENQLTKPTTKTIIQIPTNKKKKSYNNTNTNIETISRFRNCRNNLKLGQ